MSLKGGRVRINVTCSAQLTFFFQLLWFLNLKQKCSSRLSSCNSVKAKHGDQDEAIFQQVDKGNEPFPCMVDLRQSYWIWTCSWRADAIRCVAVDEGSRLRGSAPHPIDLTNKRPSVIMQREAQGNKPRRLTWQACTHAPIVPLPSRSGVHMRGCGIPPEQRRRFIGTGVPE